MPTAHIAIGTEHLIQHRRITKMPLVALDNDSTLSFTVRGGRVCVHELNSGKQTALLLPSRTDPGGISHPERARLRSVGLANGAEWRRHGARQRAAREGRAAPRAHGADVATDAMLVTGSLDGLVRCWAVQQQQQQQQSPQHGGGKTGARCLWAGRHLGCVHAIAVAAPPAPTLSASGSAQQAAAVAALVPMAFSGSDNGELKAWNLLLLAGDHAGSASSSSSSSNGSSSGGGSSGGGSSGGGGGGGGAGVARVAGVCRHHRRRAQRAQRAGRRVAMGRDPRQ